MIIGDRDLRAIKAIAEAVMNGKIKIVEDESRAKAPYIYTAEQFAKMIYTFAENALFRF